MTGAFVITSYGARHVFDLASGRSTSTPACNATDPETGAACALDAGHDDPRHSWERPAPPVFA